MLDIVQAALLQRRLPITLAGVSVHTLFKKSSVVAPIVTLEPMSKVNCNLYVLVCTYTTASIMADTYVLRRRSLHKLYL